MNTLRRLVPSLVLGLTIAVAGVSFAQSASQATGDDKHSGCCMIPGCCGDSCQMMKKDAAKHHAESADKEGCCACCGDSCQMMKKNGAKNHAMSADKQGGCCGDSCHMMKKDGAKTATASANAASSKHECCCCGESCNMKQMKKDMNTEAKP